MVKVKARDIYNLHKEESRSAFVKLVTEEEQLQFREGELAFSNGLELSDNPYKMDTEFFTKWESGWKAASQARETFLEKRNNQRRERLKSLFWEAVYPVGRIITGGITFIACWIYAIVKWGFLLGVGLGWIPSFFIAVIAGFLWPLLASLLLIALLLFICFIIIALLWG